MGRRPLSYLHQNRHGTFTFRWRPPLDVADHFAQRAFEYSLQTKYRDEAQPRALLCTIRVARLVNVLRAMKSAKNRKLITYLVRSVVLPGGAEYKVDYNPANPAEAAEADRIFTNMLADRPVTPAEFALLEKAVEPSSRPDTASPAPPTISQAFDAFCLEKTQSDAWRDPEHAKRYDHGPIINELTATVGDMQIALLSVARLRQYKQQLMGGRSSPTTKRKKLQRLASFLNWARDVAQFTRVPTAILRAPKRREEASHYHPFEDEDLKRLFESTTYRDQTFAKASEFWIPLLGLYTGARINELAQLHIGDIAELDKIPIIRINDEGEKRTKTPASTRTIPVHPALVNAGFLTYVELVRNEGWERLFPELTRSNVAKNGYGKDPSKSFTNYRRGVGVGLGRNRQKVFHSFRTTANSTLRFANVPLERRQRLVGHEASDTNNADYRPSNREDMFPIATLLDDLSKLDFKLAHPTYVAQPEHQRQRIAAARRRVKRKAGETADDRVLGALGAG